MDIFNLHCGIAKTHLNTVANRNILKVIFNDCSVIRAGTDTGVASTV